MANFAAAALGHIDLGAGIVVSPLVTAGFKIAQTPYACLGAEPDLPCGEGVSQSGLAWAIEPADPTNGVPAVISKNGLTGFSTQVDLIPEQNLAVIVFVNARQGGADTGEGSTDLAPVIVRNILFALFYGK
jgi:hypothetical protein